MSVNISVIVLAVLKSKLRMVLVPLILSVSVGCTTSGSPHMKSARIIGGTAVIGSGIGLAIIKSRADKSNREKVKFESSYNNAEIKININTATFKELMTLPRINERKAKRIIRYREKHGNFTSTEDIKKVLGIGPIIFKKIKELIKIA